MMNPNPAAHRSAIALLPEDIAADAQAKGRAAYYAAFSKNATTQDRAAIATTCETAGNAWLRALKYLPRDSTEFAAILNITLFYFGLASSKLFLLITESKQQIGLEVYKRYLLLEYKLIAMREKIPEENDFTETKHELKRIFKALADQHSLTVAQDLFLTTATTPQRIWHNATASTMFKEAATLASIPYLFAEIKALHIQLDYLTKSPLGYKISEPTQEAIDNYLHVVSTLCKKVINLNENVAHTTDAAHKNNALVERQKLDKILGEMCANELSWSQRGYRIPNVHLIPERPDTRPLPPTLRRRRATPG